MEKKYTALITKTFADGQALADIIKGKTYMADFENEYFVGEFGDAIYLPKDKFDEHFKLIKQKSYQNNAKKAYQKRATQNGKRKVLVLTLFADKDIDIIQHLEGIKQSDVEKKETKGGRGGKNEYIRRLIREDIYGFSLQHLLEYINNSKPIFINDTSTGKEFDGYDYEIPQEYLESTVKEFYVNDEGFICVDIARNKGV